MNTMLREPRKKGMIYLRKSQTIIAGDTGVLLANWISPKYDEIQDGFEYQTKAEITHIGNVAETNLFYEIQYGEKWRFDYQIAPPNKPFEFPVSLPVETEDINIIVDNKGTSDVIAEITLVGIYERERFSTIEKRRPVAINTSPLAPVSGRRII